MQIIKNIFHKLFKTRDGLYIVFGGLTTVVSLIAFYAADYVLGDVYYLVSTVFKNLIGILFAYFTNRIFVFKSENQTIKAKTAEFFQFIIFRTLVIFADLAIMFVLVDLINIPSVISTIISTVFVVVINYFLSRFIVFKTKSSVDTEKQD